MQFQPFRQWAEENLHHRSMSLLSDMIDVAVLVLEVLDYRQVIAPDWKVLNEIDQLIADEQFSVELPNE